MTAQDVVLALKDGGIDFFATLPCEKVRTLLSQVSASFRQIALTREEEGVGICAGAYLAGAKPAMLVQSSGIGNMINAICSLTRTYGLPLLILVSWRGIYREEIPAQVPLGEKLTNILSAVGVGYDIFESSQDVSLISDIAAKVYEDSAMHTILLNPGVWEEEIKGPEIKTRIEIRDGYPKRKISNAVMTRFEILKAAAEYLDGKIVVCNLGIPCRELYHVKHQKSNFYMLGSMGLASSIGLGIASFTRKDVVVIDGDGSLLMNLGALSTIAVEKPANLTILAIDNGVHGSTGNQPTATSYGADLELIAWGSGFVKTYKVASKDEILQALQLLGTGPNFVHVLAKSGNAKLPNVPLTPVEIKQNVMEEIKNEKG